MNLFDTLITQPIFNLLLGIYSAIPGGDFGIAIIIFTIIIRFAMWPLVKKQIHQVKVMRKIQPEVAKIKKLNKGNRQAESLQTMELYKKHGVSPFRSIGILLVQLPIFIALFQVIQIIALRRDEIERFAYSFMENIPSIRQMIDNPDNFNHNFLGFINITERALSSSTVVTAVSLFALAIAAAVTQYFMSRQTMPQSNSSKKFSDLMKEAANGGQPDQAEMNSLVMGKMIKFLPIFMFFIMINLPGALALYYTVSNLVAVFQQGRLLKSDVEEIVEAVDKQTKPQAKKATAKARAKQAQVTKGENITRISAKDDKPKNKKGR